MVASSTASMLRGICSTRIRGCGFKGHFSWLLARIHNEIGPRDDLVELAKHGVEFIRSCGFDSDGRMFYSVTREGQPVRKRRYVFTELFAVMAFAELARATGDEELRVQAEALFRLAERYIGEPRLRPGVVAATGDDQRLAHDGQLASSSEDAPDGASLRRPFFNTGLPSIRSVPGGRPGDGRRSLMRSQWIKDWFVPPHSG